MFKKAFNFDIVPMLVTVLFFLNCTLCGIALFNETGKLSFEPPSIKHNKLVDLNRDLPIENVSKPLPIAEKDKTVSPDVQYTQSEETNFSESLDSPFRRTGQNILTVFSALGIRRDEKVLEVGLNSMRLGILAAVLGARVTIVERQEVVDGTNFNELIDKWRPEIEAVGGHVELVLGDISEPLVQNKLKGLAFDHIFALDVLKDASADDIANDEYIESMIRMLFSFKSLDTGSIYINHPGSAGRDAGTIPQMDAVLQELGIRPVIVSYVPILRFTSFTEPGAAQLYQFDDRVFRKMQLAEQGLRVQDRPANAAADENDTYYKTPATCVLFNGAGLLRRDVLIDEVGLKIVSHKINGFDPDEVPVIIVDNAVQEEEIKRYASGISKDIAYIRWDDDLMTDETRHELMTLLVVYEGTPLGKHILSKDRFCHAKEYLYRE